MNSPTDILVRAADPKDLDTTCSQLPGVVAQVVGGPDGPFPTENGAYIVRVLAGSKDFLKFAINQQGYGTVIGERGELL